MVSRLLASLFLFALGASAVNGQSDTQLLNRLLRGHLELYGDSSERDRIESVFLEGVQIQDGVQYPMTVYKKRPNLIRFHIGTESAYVVVGSNGERAWREWRKDGERRVEQLGPEALDLLSDEAVFSSPLSDYLFDPEVDAALGPRVEVDGDPAYEVTLSVRGRADRKFYISEQSQRLLKVERMDENGAVTLATFYRDYRTVDGFPFAFEVENRTPEGKVVLTRFERIRVNGGLLSLYFEPPSDLGN